MPKRSLVSEKPAPVQQERCHLCDCTGDIHSLDGEWRGECPYCTAPVHQEPLQNIPSLTTVLAYLERLVSPEVYMGMIDVMEDEFQRKQQPAQRT